MTTGKENEAAVQRVLGITDVAHEPLEDLLPIGGYEKSPLVSLEEAVKPLISILPNIQSYAQTAKRKCKKPADNLTPDESAAIMLYTMGWQPLEECLYYALNNTLRAKDRQQKLQLWYLYLRLFLNGLLRLPAIFTTAFRGVKLNLSDRYIKGKTIVWWAFSSCTTSVDVLKSDLFMGKTGRRTMFTLKCKSARDIRKHSFFETEAEVLLLAATQFDIVGCLDQGDLHIIQLEESTPTNSLLIPILVIGSLPTTVASFKASDTIEKPTKFSLVTEETPTMTISSSASRSIPNIPANVRWKHDGVTVAGGNGQGDSTSQLYCPEGLFVDDDQTVIITDYFCHRVIQWKRGATNGEIIAGGNGKGNRLDQLDHPTDVLIDKATDSLIIADRNNGRVVRWSRRNGTKQGENLIDNIDCRGLAMDDQRYLYVADYKKHEVRRYRLGDKNGTLVAGGNGQGNGLNQLNGPTYLYVDQQQNVYVSDRLNHRVIKWNQSATEGIVVAGGNEEGNALTQLNRPYGIFVDTLGALYVSDSWNHRVMRWSQGDRQGTIIVGGNCRGAGNNQLDRPIALSCDRYGNLYVVDPVNHRVQRFDIINQSSTIPN